MLDQARSSDGHEMASVRLEVHEADVPEGNGPAPERELAGETLEFEDACFQGVTAAGILHHLPARRRADLLQQIARVSQHWVVIAEGLGEPRGPSALNATSAVYLPGGHLRRRSSGGHFWVAAMRRDLEKAGLVLDQVRRRSSRSGADVAVLAHRLDRSGDRELLRQVRKASARRHLDGAHGARVVEVGGKRYVVKLDRESAGAFLLYWARAQQLNLLAADFVRPLSRRERIAVATIAMREWRARGFGAPEPLNGRDDDLLVYPYLSLPSLADRLAAGDEAGALIASVSSEIYRRHSVAARGAPGRLALLFHLDSRCGNILIGSRGPVWVDFDRGYLPDTPPQLLKARELMTFCRSLAKFTDQSTTQTWLSEVVRAYPNREVWEAGISWLRSAAAFWQEPAAWLRRLRNRHFQSRMRLAARLESLLPLVDT